MKRVLHISDIHFGRDRPELLEPLLDAINGAGADLVAVSGDLTQRARHRQFRAAREFLDRIGPPVLCVPGNHDTPLDNLPQRIFRPWRRYRRYISRDLEPVFQDEEINVVGLNTVNPYDWQRGRAGRRALRRACAAFGEPRGRTRIVVAHHPFEHGPGATKSLTRGAERAIDALAGCGADVVLTGHLHSWGAAPFAERKGRRGALQVQAGTGLSSRLRGEENDFNILIVEPGEITVERHATPDDGTKFVLARTQRFRLGDAGWSPAPETGGGNGAAKRADG